MDGLMLDTERPAVRFWLEAARERGWEIDEGVPVSTVGLDEEATRQRVLEACGPGFPYAAVRKRLEELFVQSIEREGIAHRPGLLTLLDHLDGLGLPLAVATSTPRAIALWKLDKAGIRGRFSILACGDEVERGKPAPDIFLLAASRLGKQPAACVGFEDSPVGLRGLAAAGIRSVFIKDLMEPPDEVLATVWQRRDSLADAIDLFSA
jgi:HAD superfamily hydrolase (TIGR01509 family)